MNIRFILLASFVLLAGCTNSVDIPLESPGSDVSVETSSTVLQAGFENVETRAYVDNGLHLFWTKDDRISVFEGTTYNIQYSYLGETGSNKADFEPVAASGLHSGSNLDKPAYYAVYPYVKETEISQAGNEIAYCLPSIQQYADNSFGLGANTMVAVTANMDDKFLSFKNVGGYIVFKLYGEGTVIKSVSLTTQAGEPLAGNAIITASNTAVPSVVFKSDDSLTPTLTIDCGEGVELGSTSAEAKGFWFVVPPVTMANGFAVTFAGEDGSSITRTASGSIAIARNKVFRVPALEVKFVSNKKDFQDNGIDGLDEIDFDW